MEAHNDTDRDNDGSENSPPKMTYSQIMNEKITKMYGAERNYNYSYNTILNTL